MSEQGQPPGAGFEMAVVGLGAGVCAGGFVAWLGARLGTLFTANRDRARLLGVLVHLVNGWLFSLVYVAAFHVTGLFHAWFGAAIGLVHGAFVLLVAMPALPGLHPRMASEHQGPTVARVLEPPGFLALNYGFQAPLSVMVAHVAYGALLGLFYLRATGA